MDNKLEPFELTSVLRQQFVAARRPSKIMLRAGGANEDWIKLSESTVVTVTADGLAGLAHSVLNAERKVVLKRSIEPRKLQGFMVVHFIGQVMGMMGPVPDGIDLP